MTRQVLYKFKAGKVEPEKMAMNVFEEHLTTDCKDIPRIISETIQLENYIFRVEPESEQFEEEFINDLELGMKILPELAQEVLRCR